MDIFSYKISPTLWSLRSKELEEFLHKPIQDIEKEYLGVLEQEKSLEALLYENREEDGNLGRYYSSTARYLYELMRWEATFDKENNFRMLYLFLNKNKAKRVLDFGGGVGGLSIYLTERNLQADYADIPGITFEFAKWRFAKRGLGIRQFDSAQALPHREYDAAITYDVLEHLPDIEGAVKKISETLKEGRFFLSKSTFSGGGLHLEKNEVYSDIREFNALLKQYALEYQGRIKKSFLAQFFNAIGIKKITGVRLSKKIKYGGNFVVHLKCPSGDDKNG